MRKACISVSIYLLLDTKFNSKSNSCLDYRIDVLIWDLNCRNKGRFIDENEQIVYTTNEQITPILSNTFLNPQTRRRVNSSCPPKFIVSFSTSIMMHLCPRSRAVSGTKISGSLDWKFGASTTQFQIKLFDVELSLW